MEQIELSFGIPADFIRLCDAERRYGIDRKTLRSKLKTYRIGHRTVFLRSSDVAAMIENSIVLPRIEEPAERAVRKQPKTGKRRDLL